MTPRAGLAPLVVNVRVRQDVDAVRGKEVCLKLGSSMTDDVMNVSCWRSDVPDMYVTRSFELMGGDYVIWAATGAGASEKVNVTVAGGQ